MQNVSFFFIANITYRELPAKKPDESSDCTLSNLSLILSVESWGCCCCCSILSIDGKGKNLAPETLLPVCTEAMMVEVGANSVVDLGVVVLVVVVVVLVDGEVFRLWSASFLVDVGTGDFVVSATDKVPLTTLLVVTTETTASPIIPSSSSSSDSRCGCLVTFVVDFGDGGLVTTCGLTLGAAVRLLVVVSGFEDDCSTIFS